MKDLAAFVKVRRKQLDMTQEASAQKAGVALTVTRKIEQGKDSLSLSKVNQVLMMFGKVLERACLRGLISCVRVSLEKCGALPT